MTPRVAILADFNGCDYNQANASLLNLCDYAHCFHYPNRDTADKSTIAGYEGDPVYVFIPFRIQSAAINGITPVLQSIAMQVVAKKAGKEDFILETYTLDISASCLYQGVQQANVNTSKGYVSYPGDPYNTIIFQRATDHSYDRGTMKAYTMQYPLVLRYDSWNPILTQIPGGSTCNNDINNDIANVINSWSQLSQNGWSLVLRFSASVKGYDGYVTPFQYDIPMEVKPLGSTSDVALQYIAQLQYFDMDDNEVPYLITGAQTRIRCIATPNGSTLPGDYGQSGCNAFWGAFFIDLPGSGGITARHWASTEIPSEKGSPFSAAPVLAPPYMPYAYGNVTMNVDGISILFETIYDDTILNWCSKGKPVIIPRWGFKSIALETDDGIDIETDGGNIIIPD